METPTHFFFCCMQIDRCFVCCGFVALWLGRLGSASCRAPAYYPGYRGSQCGGNRQVKYACLQQHPQTICHQTNEQLVVANEKVSFTHLKACLLCDCG